MTTSPHPEHRKAVMRTHPRAFLALCTLLASVPPGVGTDNRPSARRAGCGWEPPRPSELRAAVCVTGQVARLELQSKIDHLLIPNNRSARLDVYLLLQDDNSTSFSLELPGDDGSCRHSPSSLKEATEVLARHTQVYAYGQTREKEIPADPAKWPDIVAVNDEQRASLVTNHVYQLAAWKACGEAVKQREAEEGFQYDVILRLREASAVVLPFDLHTALVQSGFEGKDLVDGQETPMASEDCVPQPRVVTKACAAWRGYPDKAMLIPRRYLEGALLGPFDDYTEIVGERSPATSVEQYLKIALDRHDVPVVMRVQPTLMPVTDTRCERGDYCLVRTGKDCRPRKMAGSWAVCKRTYKMWEGVQRIKSDPDDEPARRRGRLKLQAKLKRGRKRTMMQREIMKRPSIRFQGRS